MQGQYSNEEILAMPGIVSTIYQIKKGRIVRVIGRTINFYHQHPDGSWTNFDCRTRS